MSDNVKQARIPQWEQELKEQKFSWPVFAFEEVASTMDMARELLLTPPYLVLARRQSHGRGRSGKVWNAPDDALKMTLALPIHDRTKLAEGFSLYVGIVITKILKATINVDLKVKWPNDIFSAAGKKVGGVLIETTSENRLLIGIGLNTISIPTIREATSLYSLTGKTVPESPLLASQIAHALIATYQDFLSEGISKAEWAKVGYGIGKHARVYDGDALKLQGVFQGITEKGEAVFETAHDVTTNIVSGTLRFDCDRDELHEAILHPSG